MTDITELAQRMKAAAEKATPGQWERGDGKHGGELLVYCDDALGSAVCEATSEYNAIPKYQRINNLDFIALANPANILALVEALEKAQQVDEELCRLLPPGAEYMDPPDGGDVTPLEGVHRMVADYRQRIAELESRTVTDWIEHDGKWRPESLGLDELVYLKTRKQELKIPYPAGKVKGWMNTGGDMDVMAYKLASPQASTVTAAAADVLAERKRQVTTEGWTPEHDDQHVNFEMAIAGGLYAISAVDSHHKLRNSAPSAWPWDRKWWKPDGPRRDLVKAGALILAEIERLDRAAGIKVEVE